MSAVLVLASASPRRRQLLTEAGIACEVVPSQVAEVQRPGESPEAFARRAAREKAADVVRSRPLACVLAADTVVVVDGLVFGKPVDRGDARRMLATLSGRTHRVLTAVTLITPTGGEEVAVESEVAFREITFGEIEAYLDSGEPFDKAGAYGVQGRARAFVRHVHGSHSNVVGLPLEAVVPMLERHLRRAAAVRSTTG